MEPDPDLYAAHLVEVFVAVRRVLHPRGTLWLNLGDSYNAYNGNRGTLSRFAGERELKEPKFPSGNGLAVKSLANKNLIGVPWRVAFALQRDGWYLRDAIIWAKSLVDETGTLTGNGMPGSQQDRCTFGYETIFQFSRSPRYFFDGEAIRTKSGAWRRNVWAIKTEASDVAHYAVMPQSVARLCVMAGTSEEGVCGACGAPWERVLQKEPDNRGYPNGPGGKKHRMNPDRNESHSPGTLCEVARWRVETLGWHPTCRCEAAAVPATVLDCFAGSGTTGVAALALGRHFIGIELNSDYAAMARRRLAGVNLPLPF